MKVVILNTADAHGGAAIASWRLLHALVGEGVDARMLVVDRSTADPLVDVAGTAEQRRWAFLRERIGIFAANGLNRRDLFKVSTARYGVDVLSHPWLRSADVVCLNWINQGMLSLTDVGRLAAMGKRLVWTLHDMWCMTGICHHAYGCDGYERECGHCRFMRFPYGNDLSHRVWKRKKRIYDNADIHFVAVSGWLADCCRRSALLEGRAVPVIHNAMAVDSYSWQRTGNKDKKVVTMGAARLDDPVKGFGLLIEAANVIADSHPDCNIELQLFGSIRDESLLGQIRLPYRWVGAVAPEKVADLMAAGDVVVSSSHFETFGMTLAEGQAAGCLAVAFDHGGQSDIITHRRDGWLAAYPDAGSLAEGILWAVSQSVDRKALHDSVAARFSYGAVARKYIDLFNELLRKE